MGLFNPRRSTAIGLGGISPVAGAAVGGLLGGGKKPPKYTTLPAGRTVVRGGMDTQAPVAAGTPDVTLKDKAAQASIRAGQAFTPSMAPAAPAANRGGLGGGGLGNMVGAALQRRQRQAAPAGGGTMYAGGTPGFYAPQVGTGRLPGYADGGKVIKRKPNGKGC